MDVIITPHVWPEVLFLQGTLIQKCTMVNGGAATNFSLLNLKSPNKFSNMNIKETIYYVTNKYLLEIITTTNRNSA